MLLWKWNAEVCEGTSSFCFCFLISTLETEQQDLNAGIHVSGCCQIPFKCNYIYISAYGSVGDAVLDYKWYKRMQTVAVKAIQKSAPPGIITDGLACKHHGSRLQPPEQCHHSALGRDAVEPHSLFARSAHSKQQCPRALQWMGTLIHEIAKPTRTGYLKRGQKKGKSLSHHI